MVSKLKIADSFSLPLDAVTQTFAILAKRRVGKTYTASVMAEEMVEHGLPFVALDPTGAWWGLRASADGKSEGLPVIIIGGSHGDVPLEATAGKVIADLVVDHPGFYVIDLSRTQSNAEQDRFAMEFAERLYRRKEERPDPLHLFIDEADSFAPQRPIKGQERMLGAYEALVRRGGIRGIGVTLISQRPAVINKNVLTQTECLVVLQITAPQDQKAVDEWIEKNGTREQRDQMMASLASLPKGEAWFWSPAWLDVFQRVRIRERHTFNSSATPRAGVKQVVPQHLAPVDLEQLRGKIAETIERAKADDPKELRRQMADLQKQLKARPVSVEPAVQVKIERVEVPIWREGQVEALQAAVKAMNDISVEQLAAAVKTLKEIGDQLVGSVAILRQALLAAKPVLHPLPARLPAPAPVRLSQPEPGRKTRLGDGRESGEITRPQQAILDALAAFEALGVEAPARSNVAVFADQSPTSSGFTNNLGALRTAGLIDYPGSGRVTLTDAGRSRARSDVPIRTLDDLHAAWFAKLPRPKVAILQRLIEIYPEAIGREALAERAQQRATSSGYTNNLGALHSLGLVQYPQPGHVAATELLFPELLTR